MSSIISNNMERKSIEYLTQTLLNWQAIEVRTVPVVMCQVLCESSPTDSSNEYRFHWFVDCTETYVHNHRYTFETYCLEGEYNETSWEIVDDLNGATTYRFPKISGNHLGPVEYASGSLQRARIRRHFPGNVLHVNTDQFHSIASVNQSTDHVLTFVAREKTPLAEQYAYILSSTDVIEAPIEHIRAATSEERLAMQLKLQQTLQQMLRRTQAGF